MKYILLISFILITFSMAFAQVQWAENGIPVRQGVNIEWARSAVTLEDGSVVFVWSDTRRGDRDVWIQKVDVNGNLIWGEQSVDGNWKEGILINGEINRQEDIVIIDAGSNEVIVAWVDFRNEDEGDIYAQKISADGSLLWEESGVPLCLAGNIQISLNIVSDENGGAYIIWLDSRNTGGSDIYGTHILADGSIADGWQLNGSPIVSAFASQNQHTFWEDGTGGAIVVWHDERNADNENIYMQRIAADGTLLWETNGNLVSDAEGSQETPKIKPDGTGNFIITWRDKRNENLGDIYTQRIDLTGNILWENDVVVYSGDGIQRNPRSATASDNGLIIVWEDGRNDYYDKDLYSQKLDINGVLLWNPEGVEICVAANDQLNPRIAGDANGGAWIIWSDGRIQDHPHEDIYIQHLNSTGEIIFDADGKLICDAFGEQFNPLLKINSGGFIYAVWGDNRTGSTGMYVQIFNSTGEEVLTSEKIIYYGLCGDALNYKILKNDNNPVMIWKDTRNASIANQIYMQVMSSNGNMLLEKNGKAITRMTGYDQEFLDAVLFPNSNIVAAVWAEIREFDNQIFAQAIDLEGNSLWDTLGVAVGAFDEEQKNPYISVKENSGSYEYYIGWSDNRDNWDFGIMTQKINENGQLQWADEGILVSDLAGDDILTDVVENFYIWQNEIWPDNNIYVKLIDENGNTAANWPDEGFLICGASRNQLNAKGLLVPEGLLIIWQDQRNDQYDIYGQLITYDCEILWEENGRPLVTVENDQDKGNFIYNNDFFMVWEDFRDSLNTDVYIQKYNMNGETQWQDNGNAVVNKNYYQSQPYVVQNADNFLVFWEDYEQATESDLFVQNINSNGEQQWDENGLVICNAIKKQNKPLAVSDENNYNTFVIWEDTRSSGKTDIYNIYTQLVRTDGSFSEDELIKPATITLKNYPNPFNPETTISFTLTTENTQIQSFFLTGQAENTEIIIYNIKGQRIREFKIDNSKLKINEVVWDGKDANGKAVSSGIYFCKLVTADKITATRKMLLLK